MDLNELKKVQRAAQEYLSRGHPLHIPINNGGICSEEWSVGADGIERHFAVNYLGHFVLTTALLDRLRESQPSRFVDVRYDYLSNTVLLLGSREERSLLGTEKSEALHNTIVTHAFFCQLCCVRDPASGWLRPLDNQR